MKNFSNVFPVIHDFLFELHSLRKLFTFYEQLIFLSGFSNNKWNEKNNTIIFSFQSEFMHSITVSQSQFV